MIRTFDLGKGQAAQHRDIALYSPVLAVLGTDTDTQADWLAAGQALANVLLRARVEDVRSRGARGPRSTPYSGERRCVTRWCSAYRAPHESCRRNRRTIRGLRPARADAAGSAIPTGKRRFSRECSGPKADSDLRGFDVVWVVNDNCLPSQADLVCPPAFHAYAAAGTFRTSFTSSFQPGAIHGSSSSPDCLHPPHAQKLAPASEPRRRPGRSVSVSASPPLYLPSRGSGRRHSNERIRLRCRDAVR